jgi:DnaJ homolog subfamily C member 19
MILRLAELALLACLAIRFISGKWPWVLWPNMFNGLKRPSDEKHARILLGVAPDAGREDIIDAHRRLIAQVHPDRGGSNTAVHEANDARDLLLERLGPRNRAGQRG